MCKNCSDTSEHNLPRALSQPPLPPTFHLSFDRTSFLHLAWPTSIHASKLGSDVTRLPEKSALIGPIAPCATHRLPLPISEGGKCFSWMCHPTSHDTVTSGREGSLAYCICIPSAQHSAWLEKYSINIFFWLNIKWLVSWKKERKKKRKKEGRKEGRREGKEKKEGRKGGRKRTKCTWEFRT